jgi:hypothetical protein
MKTANEQLELFASNRKEEPAQVMNIKGRAPFGKFKKELEGNANYLYIGRGTIWGNRFKLKEHGGEYTREEAIALYEEEIRTKPELLAQLPTLKGKTLGCHCKPEACHGDILIKLLTEATQ